MDSKKILVVYFSRTGITRKVSQDLAKSLNCDIQEIKSIPSYPIGFRGYQRALFDAVFKRKVSVRIAVDNLQKYELLIVGGPIWGGSISTPVRNFLETFKGQIKDFGFFSTQGGASSRQKISNQVFEATGRKPRALMILSQKDFARDEAKNKTADFISELNLGSKESKPRAASERTVSP